MFYLLDQNIILNILFLVIRDQISNPYKSNKNHKDNFWKQGKR
jgi:hypothetical protein